MEAALCTLCLKLSSLVVEEVNFLDDVGDKVNISQDKLRLMQAFLADKASNAGNRLELTLVEPVIDIVFDLENAIDEFRFRFSRPGVIDERHSSLRWLASLYRASKSLVARRRIGIAVDKINFRLEQLLQTRAGLDRASGPHPGGSGSSDKERFCPEEEAQLFGIETRREEVWKLLEEEGKAVAVKGMGGSGKTTLADVIYHSDCAKANFEQRARITVSKSAKGEDVLKSIIEKLRIASGDGIDSYAHTVNEFLRGKSYLIVLDDVWEARLLREIQGAFPLGGRLILTTRIGDVAADFAQRFRGCVYELEPLSKDDSWELLCNKAFPQSSPPAGDLAKICRKILRRCEGLPLAIAAVGGLLATKDRTSIEQFERVHRRLAEELQGRPDPLERIFSLSYDDLEDNLKACLLYMTVFPKEGVLKSRLVQLWIAENFVERRNGSSSTLEEIGDDYFNKLLNRSLIQPAEKRADGSVKTCRFHDIVRDFLAVKASNELFTAAADSKGNTLPKRIRCLAVHDTGKNVLRRDRHWLSELRSLLLFRVAELSPGLVSELVKGSSLLQVLDLSGAPIPDFPKGITALCNLRYLSLSGTEVKLLPSSVGKLWNLLVLNLKETRIEELPKEILRASSLRHVRIHRRVQHGPSEVFEETRGFKGLAGIDALFSLQSLCHVDAAEASPDTWRSIGELTELRRLGLLGLKREDGVGLCSALERMTRLLTLELQSREGNEILSLDSLPSIPEWCLQRLRIAGRLERLPHWIPKLAGLKFLVLRFSGLSGDKLQRLQDLSNLVELKLYKAHDGEKLCFGAKCFPHLKVLEIKNSGRLRTVSFDAGAVPSLEKLVLEQCKMLKELPSGIERLRKLQRLELIDMDAELSQRLRQRDHSDEEYSRVRHVPSIETSSRRLRDGADEVTSRLQSYAIDSFFCALKIL